MTELDCRQQLNEQIERNRSTRGSFEQFATHRQRVMALLAEAAAPSGRLLLLGAGNCNDVDLSQLLGLYAEVHLVDWDADALQQAADRQQVSGEGRLIRHGGIDLASADRLPVDGCRAVASLCVLSQLIDSASGALGLSNRELPGRVASIRQQHLRQMVDALEPGGTGLVISDFVSSTTAPELETAAEEELPAIVSRCLHAGNFFLGLHPGVLHRELTTDPDLRKRVSCQNPSKPWNWKLGKRVYAVMAVRFQRLK